MMLLVGFLLISAVGGQLVRSFDWRMYILIAMTASFLALAYYYDQGLW
jgi:hypothetical protein